MLRYYDEQKLLIPISVDEATGYRLYSADQIEHLNRIILLRDMGFGVKEIKKLIKDWDPEFLKSNLQEQIKKTQEVIQLENSRLKQIQGYLADLNSRDRKLNIQIIMKQLPLQHVLSLRRIVPNYYCEAALWQEMGKSLGDMKNPEAMQSFSIYHDTDYKEQDVDIEICIVTEKERLGACTDLIYRQLEQVNQAACFMIYGPYSNIGPAYREFAFWMEQHPEYQMTGENRQICHVSACQTSNPEEYITELQIPLKIK